MMARKERSACPAQVEFPAQLDHQELLVQKVSPEELFKSMGLLDPPANVDHLEPLVQKAALERMETLDQLEKLDLSAMKAKLAPKETPASLAQQDCKANKVQKVLAILVHLHVLLQVIKPLNGMVPTVWIMQYNHFFYFILFTFTKIQSTIRKQKGTNSIFGT